MNEKQVKLKVSEVWQAFAVDPESMQRSARVIRNYRRHWGMFIAWLQMAHPEIQYCQQLSKATGKEYAIYLNAQVGSTSTYNRHIMQIRRIFEAAIDIDENVVNPMSRLKRLSVTDVIGKEMFTDSELKRLFADGDAEFVRLCAIGLYTTQRFEVARKLRWEMFEGDLSYLYVAHAKTGAPGSMRVPKPLREILSRVPCAERTEYVCPSYASPANSVASRHFQLHLKALGINTQREVERRPGRRRMACVKGFHSFRHTAITIAKRNCGNIAKIKRWAGHSSDAMSDYYTHLDADDAGDAADSVGKFW